MLGDLRDPKLDLVGVAPSERTEVVRFGVAKRRHDGGIANQLSQGTPMLARKDSNASCAKVK